jgi:RHS repeat-associated protein
MNRAGTNYFYHADAIGNVTEVTSTNGTKLEFYNYDVFGAPTIRNSSSNVIANSAISNRFMFQGRDRDPDTGLYNFRYRYYSPSLGRFVQTDPIGSRYDINLYRFVLNNPTKLTDAFGLAPGDPYPSADAAAKDAMKDICKKCKDEDKEHAGSVYKNSNGTYSYTSAVPGDQHSSPYVPNPPGTSNAGHYHCHGAESGPAYDDENIGKGDKKGADKDGAPIYLVTPSGAMKKYSPDPDKKGRGPESPLGQCDCK